MAEIKMRQIFGTVRRNELLKQQLFRAGLLLTG